MGYLTLTCDRTSLPAFYRCISSLCICPVNTIAPHLCHRTAIHPIRDHSFDIVHTHRVPIVRHSVAIYDAHVRVHILFAHYHNINSNSCLRRDRTHSHALHASRMPICMYDCDIDERHFLSKYRRRARPAMNRSMWMNRYWWWC